MKSRIVFLFTLISLAVALLLFRAASLQIWPDQRLSSLRKKQFETHISLHGRRGDIFDSKHNELAVSAPSYSLFADPSLIKKPKQTASRLASLLGVSVNTMKAKLLTKGKFVWLERRLSEAKKDQINALEISGIGFIEESIRVYPNDSLGRAVLGWVGVDDKGLEGLELSFNDSLSGQNKVINLQRDARGRPLIVNGQVFSEAPDGSDLELSLDRDLQYKLESELKKVLSEERAEASFGVILDVRTSEVLAMASVNTGSPTRGLDPRIKRNQSISDSFELGSVVKPLLVAGALQHKEITEDTKFDCEGGSLRIDDKVIHESDQNHHFHKLNPAEIIAFSSNIGAAKIGLRLGANRVREIYESFGLGSKTEIELPGESRGILQKLPWRRHLLANASFGHGVTITPLQIANAYAAIANGGWLHRPTLVKRLIDVDTGTSLDTPVKTIRRVLSEDVALAMRPMLVAATGPEATGFRARVAGYLVAGKTGTAQKVDPNGRGYLKDTYISSFVGFLPANEPRFVIYIGVDSPRTHRYGGEVAAPVFAKMAQYAVREYGLAPAYPNAMNEVKIQMPDETANEALVRSSRTEDLAKDFSTRVPDLKNLSVSEVLKVLINQNLEMSFRGSGRVARSHPEGGEPWPDPLHKKLDLELSSQQ